MITRRRRVGLAATAVALASAAAALAGGLATASGHSGPLPATTDAGSQLSGLSPRQLAGQRVIYSYAGLTPPAGLFTQIKNGQAAGVIFFGDNISSEAQIKGVISQLQQAAAQSRVHEPLLMMTDQEGGEVRRLPGAPVALRSRSVNRQTRLPRRGRPVTAPGSTSRALR